MVKSLVSLESNPPNKMMWEHGTPQKEGWRNTEEEDGTMHSEEDDAPSPFTTSGNDDGPAEQTNDSSSIMGLMRKFQTDATRRLSSGWTASPIRRVTSTTDHPNKKKE